MTIDWREVWATIGVGAVVVFIICLGWSLI